MLVSYMCMYIYPHYNRCTKYICMYISHSDGTSVPMYNYTLISSQYCSVIIRRAPAKIPPDHWFRLVRRRLHADMPSPPFFSSVPLHRATCSLGPCISLAYRIHTTHTHPCGRPTCRSRGSKSDACAVIDNGLCYICMDNYIHSVVWVSCS